MKSIINLFVIILFCFQIITCNNIEIITNSERSDGFGAQFQAIIAAAVFAELNNIKFVYRPFKAMEHNYENESNFLKKKEDLINFIGNFELLNSSHEIKENKNYKDFFDANIEKCFKSNALKKIKKIFRENKNIKNHFNNNRFNIAMHVRRYNPHDSRLEGPDTPDIYYLKIIKQLKKIYSSKTPLIHIYSQGSIDKFKSYNLKDVVLHLDESVEDTFVSMVFADVLVASRSSFSYTAALLSDNIVYYMPFWHQPLPHWISTDLLILNLTEHYKKYNLISDKPDILITPMSEKIGVTWSSGNVWDKQLIQKFYSLLSAHNDFFVCLDIGAQTGSFSLLAKYFPNSKWYAFEPIQEAAYNLKENLKINNINNVDVHEIAISDVKNCAILKLPNINNWGCSTIGSNVLRFDIFSERKIDCTTLDKFINDKNIKKVHFIKIDTEGAELKILKGAKNLILRDHPVILMEYNETNMKQFSINKEELHKLLKELEYSWQFVGEDDILCTPKIR